MGVNAAIRCCCFSFVFSAFLSLSFSLALRRCHCQSSSTFTVLFFVISNSFYRFFYIYCACFSTPNTVTHFPFSVGSIWFCFYSNFVIFDSLINRIMKSNDEHNENQSIIFFRSFFYQYYYDCFLCRFDFSFSCDLLFRMCSRAHVSVL